MKPIDEMTAITEQELATDFDAILDRVIAGESFILDRGTKNAVVLIPYDEDTAALIQHQNKTQPVSSDPES